MSRANIRNTCMSLSKNVKVVQSLVWFWHACTQCTRIMHGTFVWYQTASVIHINCNWFNTILRRMIGHAALSVELPIYREPCSVPEEIMLTIVRFETSTALQVRMDNLTEWHSQLWSLLYLS